jgi:hypothetical protein
MWTETTMGKELVAIRLDCGTKNQLVRLAGLTQVRRGRIVTWAELVREALRRYISQETAK